jgi:drug/metabolite transporter (DMT)-like permease
MAHHANVNIMLNKLLIPISIICWTVWSIANRVVASKSHPFYVNLSNYMIGFLCIPLFYYIIKNDHAPKLTTSTALWAIAGSSAGLIAYAAFTYALRTRDLGTTSILCSSYQLLAFLLSVAFLGERITLPKAGGVLLVLIGTALLVRP